MHPLHMMCAILFTFLFYQCIAHKCYVVIIVPITAQNYDLTCAIYKFHFLMFICLPKDYKVISSQTGQTKNGSIACQYSCGNHTPVKQQIPVNTEMSTASMLVLLLTRSMLNLLFRMSSLKINFMDIVTANFEGGQEILFKDFCIQLEHQHIVDAVKYVSPKMSSSKFDQ